MALDEIGMGLGGGTLLGTVLTYLGFKQRIDRLEKSNDDIKKEIRFVDTCIEIHKAVEKRLGSIEEKQDTMLAVVLELKARK